MEFKRKKNLQFVVMETRQMDNWLQLMTVEVDEVSLLGVLYSKENKNYYFSLFR